MLAQSVTVWRARRLASAVRRETLDSGCCFRKRPCLGRRPRGRRRDRQDVRGALRPHPRRLCPAAPRPLAGEEGTHHHSGGEQRQHRQAPVHDRQRQSGRPPQLSQLHRGDAARPLSRGRRGGDHPQPAARHRRGDARRSAGHAGGNQAGAADLADRHVRRHSQRRDLHFLRRGRHRHRLCPYGRRRCHSRQPAIQPAHRPRLRYRRLYQRPALDRAARRGAILRPLRHHAVLGRRWRLRSRHRPPLPHAVRRCA